MFKYKQEKDKQNKIKITGKTMLILAVVCLAAGIFLKKDFFTKEKLLNAKENFRINLASQSQFEEQRKKLIGEWERSQKSSSGTWGHYKWIFRENGTFSYEMETHLGSGFANLDGTWKLVGKDKIKLASSAPEGSKEKSEAFVAQIDIFKEKIELITSGGGGIFEGEFTKSK